MYKCKEFWLLPGVISLKALLILFLNGLFLGESKWGCKRSISLFLEVYRGKRHNISKEYSNSLLFAVFVNQNQPSKSLLIIIQSS